MFRLLQCLRSGCFNMHRHARHRWRATHPTSERKQRQAAPQALRDLASGSSSANSDWVAQKLGGQWVKWFCVSCFKVCNRMHAAHADPTLDDVLAPG